MIQHGTFLRVLDNSGAKLVLCIKVLSGYRRRYAGVGDQILISIKKTRKKTKSFIKNKKRRNLFCFNFTNKAKFCCSKWD